MMRIELVAKDPREVVLKVEGRLVEETANALKKEGSYWLGQADRLVLDLTELRFVDEVGLTLLQGWTGRRVLLRGASHFIRTLLHRRGIHMIDSEG